MIRLLVLVITLSLVAGCSTKPSRYKMDQDKAPAGEFDASTVPLVVPKWEPLSRQGNASTYVVRGQSYKVLPSAKGYAETGISSWYGLKFHGELTSNGEHYNMYDFSAAHKTLPLPSYVKVTNIDNGRELIVRVNDRGPFHDDRIIDLSYAAAIRLGFQDKGTARVRLETIAPDAPVTSSTGLLQGSSKGASPSSADRLASFVQVAAFSSKGSAEAMSSRIEGELGISSVFVAQAENSPKPLYRVRIGPFDNESEARRTVDKLKQQAIGSPQVITRSVKAAGH
jgi:peptidoglycan lytic transglycosylase